MCERGLKAKNERRGLMSEKNNKGGHYASVAVSENGQCKPAAARRKIQRRGDADKLMALGGWTEELMRRASGRAYAHLQLRGIKLDLKCACPQQALFHKHDGVAHAPELWADGEGRAVREKCGVDDVDDVAQLAVAILCLHCDKKRRGEDSDV